MILNKFVMNDVVPGGRRMCALPDLDLNNAPECFNTFSLVRLIDAMKFYSRQNIGVFDLNLTCSVCCHYEMH